MSVSEVLSEKRGQALVITFNRPDFGNALTLEMAQQLFTILKNATTDRSVRAVLLCGAGHDFMDGPDLSPYKGNFSAALEKASQVILPYHSAIRELRAMDKPVLAAVEGKVSGTGFSLMLASDFVIAGRSAQIQSGVASCGLSPDGGASYYLPYKVGLSRAMEILTETEPLDAARAEKLSLVNRVVEDQELESAALAWLDKLADGPTKAYGAIKQLTQLAFEHDFPTHLSLENTFLGHSFRSFDFREAVNAQAAGRDPKFTGS